MECSQSHVTKKEAQTASHERVTVYTEVELIS